MKANKQRSIDVDGNGAFRREGSISRLIQIAPTENSLNNETEQAIIDMTDMHSSLLLNVNAPHKKLCFSYVFSNASIHTVASVETKDAQQLCFLQLAFF
ncbi:hypothetical protein BC8716_08155 [Shouchella clausii]|nr:hypothetical protein BC8716_08155 [Shouchella clausii]QNM42277.1 hypothetical protein DUT88_05000 [Shouchella clausii]